MPNLKRIAADSVEFALNKADHYRLLNEPLHAESICLDVLEVDSTNQRALITLLLALTDQFSARMHETHHRAESILPRLNEPYDRHYYAGIIHERWAITQNDLGNATSSVPQWIAKAMQCYEQAEQLAGPENPDPVLRWNTCSRLRDRIHIGGNESATLTRDIHSEFGDDVPPQ